MEDMITDPVVITGIGVISPYGIGLDRFRKGLLSLRICINGKVESHNLQLHRLLKGAYFSDFDPAGFDNSSVFRRLARGAQFSIIATEEALSDSRLSPVENIGLIFSSSRIVLEKTEQFYQNLLRKGPRLVNPLVFQESVNNAPASHITIRYGIKGPSLTVVNGGTGTINSIAIAMEWIETEKVNAVLVLSAESLTPLSQIFHAYAKGHAPVKDRGINECCPFDIRRNGYIFGEGAVALVLERRSRAIKRKADIKAEILGYGINHDAYGVARYHPDGSGIGLAMRQALRMADLNTGSVEWLLSSANSSPYGDLAEAKAINHLFGRDRCPPVSAIKSLIGETDAASGGFNILAAITGMMDGFLYPTVNCEIPDPGCDLNHVLDRPVQKNVSIVMANAVWYGGCNSSIVIKSPEH